MARTIEQIEQDSNAQVVTEVFGKPVTRGELSKAFDRVAHPENWKFPIDRVVELNDVEMETIRHAVVFFAGGGTAFTALPGGTLPRCKYRVTAPGYYRLIGA